MDWACAEEGQCIYWTKDAADGAARQEKRERPQRRFKDVVNEDIQRVGITENDDRDRVRWKEMIRCGDP